MENLSRMSTFRVGIEATKCVWQNTSVSNMDGTNDQATLFQNDSSKKLSTPASRYRELTDVVALNSSSYPQ